SASGNRSGGAPASHRPGRVAEGHRAGGTQKGSGGTGAGGNYRGLEGGLVPCPDDAGTDRGTEAKLALNHRLSPFSSGNVGGHPRLDGGRFRIDGNADSVGDGR